MVGHLVVVGMLRGYALLYSMCDLKAAQMNVRCSLIWELILDEFKLGHNTTEAIKNICCSKGEGTFDHYKVTIWFKKFCLVCKNLNLARSGRPKTEDSEAMLKTIETNPASLAFYSLV